MGAKKVVGEKVTKRRTTLTPSAPIVSDALRSFAATLPADCAARAKPGFGFSPEHDRVWAAGFPHLVWLSPSLPDDLDEATTALVWSELHGQCEWPRVVAYRYLRALRGAWAVDAGHPPWTALVHLADDADPADAVWRTDALAMLRESTHPKHELPTAKIDVHVFEALLGTDAVTETVISALEGLEDEELVEWAVDLCRRVHWVGLMLERLPGAVAEARRVRLRAILERAHRAWPFPDEPYRTSGMTNDAGWLPIKLEVILGGAAAVEKYATRFDGAIYGWQLLFAGDDPALIREHVAKMKPSKHVATFARLAYLGGDQVLEHYLATWKKHTGHQEHAQMVRTFGEIRDERVTAWMLEMAATSKAKALATEWFTVHHEYARPLLERTARKGDATATKILQKLP